MTVPWTCSQASCFDSKALGLVDGAHFFKVDNRDFPDYIFLAFTILEILGNNPPPPKPFLLYLHIVEGLKEKGGFGGRI